VVTNPAPCILPDGRVYLYYRSNTPQGLRIGLAVADSPKGPYTRVHDDPILEGMNVEDPFAWYNGTQFEMLAKDMTGYITGEIHAGAHLHSSDGVKWIADGKGYSRNVLWNDGRRIEQGCLASADTLRYRRQAGVPVCRNSRRPRRIQKRIKHLDYGDTSIKVT